MNYEKTAASILELAGGKANISAVTHCVTRASSDTEGQMVW